MDQPIRPKPSNAHKPRVRLPARPLRRGGQNLYRVVVPRFYAMPLDGWMVRLVVRDYVAVANLPTLAHAMAAAVEYAKFKDICFGVKA